MHIEISFRGLPFTPVKEQVVYIEHRYDVKLNKFIRDNYEWLKKTFLSWNLDFCYLPLLAEETIAYNAPYFTDQQRNELASRIPRLNDFLAPAGQIDRPSLLFGLDTPADNADGNIVLQGVTIDLKWYASTKTTFAKLAKEISLLIKQKEELRNSDELLYRIEEDDGQPTRVGDEMPRYGIGSQDIRDSISSQNQNEEVDWTNRIRYSLRIDSENDEKPHSSIHFRTEDNDVADSNFDSQSQLIINEIKERIEALRNRGVNTMFLHEIIDAGEKLSRLKITKDNRILLPDYDNLEIKMPVLQKAVFFLFLRHPEGIRFKELTDYYSELLQIYRKMNPMGGHIKQEQSIRDVTNPCRNSINEKCARIREAFVSCFDDRLAQNYYITGKRGEAKRITLDDSMIIWEE